MTEKNETDETANDVRDVSDSNTERCIKYKFESDFWSKLYYQGFQDNDLSHEQYMSVAFDVYEEHGQEAFKEFLKKAPWHK